MRQHHVRDPHDPVVLDLALAANTPVLVSGDANLLALRQEVVPLQIINPANGGYGSYSNSSINSTALAYVDSTLSGATSIGAILLIAQDTTPGNEFFCWAFKTHGGNDELHRDSCHALYKSPGTMGWNSIAVFPRTSKQFYGQVVLHCYSGNSFGGLPSGSGAGRQRFDPAPEELIRQDRSR